MNKRERYVEVYKQMELLGITDITTPRQSRNGTVAWRLPIKDQDTGILIEVASFKSGYVRNQGKSCHSNFQLNKRCENEAEYFKLPNGDYRKFTTRGCVLIPIEIDRLEYLISYCLKNYYIKNANRVADGDYVPKWKHEHEINKAEKFDNEAWEFKHDKIRDLENKLDTIKRIADYETI